MKIYNYFLILSLCFFVQVGFADSPITSTNFSEAYLDIDIVQKAKDESKLTAELADYLSNPNNPVDVKAALVNAISWKTEGKNNSSIYFAYLVDKYNMSEENYDDTLFSPDELMALGYLKVMDNYFNPKRAIPTLEKAYEKNNRSFTIAIILALTKAQDAMDSGDWCQVWKLAEAVFNDDSLVQDLRPEAKKIILDYMTLYQDDCK